MKVKDCSNCKQESKKQINSLPDWEVKKKIIIEKWIEETEHVKCSECANFTKNTDYEMEEKICAECNKTYFLKKNVYFDIEPDKHNETCSQTSTKNKTSKGMSGGMIALIIGAIVLVIVGFLVWDFKRNKKSNE
jgi:hypothetical protein